MYVYIYIVNLIYIVYMGFIDFLNVKLYIWIVLIYIILRVM